MEPEFVQDEAIEKRQPKDEISDLIRLAEQSERLAAAVLRIKRAALSLTNPGDWVNQGGKPYLQACGAEKVGMSFHVSWHFDQEPEFEKFDNGHFMYTYRGQFSYLTARIEVIGTRSSLDPFFSKGKENVDIPPDMIDRGDVKKSALTNCIVNGVTRLLGLRNCSWEDLERAGIKKDQVAGIEYKKPEMAEEAQGQITEMETWLAEICASTKEVEAYIEKATTFKGKDGTEVPGKKTLAKLTEKQVPRLHAKIKADYAKWQKAHGQSEAKPSTESKQSPAGDKINDNQLKVLRNMLERKSLSEEGFATNYGKALTELMGNEVNAALEFIQGVE